MSQEIFALVGFPSDVGRSLQNFEVPWADPNGLKKCDLSAADRIAESDKGRRNASRIGFRIDALI
jgi:hypothetical protein